MRSTLRSFAFLDVILLILIGMQLWATLGHPLSDKLSEKIQVILMFPMFFLILIGAVGLYSTKKFGFILYYIQFPFRLYLYIFSLAFITLIPEALAIYDDKLFDILLKMCFVAEFIRLYLTIMMHRKFLSSYK
jgi:hypothetical protein